MPFSRSLKKGSLIRVKKGLYLVPNLTNRPYSREIVANLIYGPSYVSLDYALRYHGLIPERVEEVTSVTRNREKIFETPIGRFSYRALRPALFPLGVTQADAGDGRHFLIATPEKALVDKLWLYARKLDPEALSAYLFEDLRIDRQGFRSLHSGRLKSILVRYREPVFRALHALARSEREPK